MARSWVTLAWAAPGFVWLGFYLIAPLVFIVLMSFWTPDTSGGFVKDWTTQNYSELLHPFSLDNAYWKDMLRTFQISVIAVAACLGLRLPGRVLPGLKVENLRYQIVLFILALAPFWTSFLTRSVAWAFPLMGSHGALNQFLVKLGVSSYDHPLLEHPVHAAIGAAGDDPALHPVHGHADLLPARAGRPARDRGGPRPRRQLVAARSARSILPQTMPGIVIGSIFIFVLTMGEYGTVKVIGGGDITSVGTYTSSPDRRHPSYPQGRRRPCCS